MSERDGDQAWEAALGQPADLLRGPGAPSFTSRLEAWAADARVDDAARRRSRERWLRDAAEQEATVVGVLLDLAERQTPIVVTTAGRRVHGVVSAMGADFVGLRQPTGAEALVALRSIGQIGTVGRADRTMGDRMVTSELHLLEVLMQLAADGERVRVVTSHGDVVAGSVRTVGHDVVVLRADGDPPVTTYLPSAAIAEVALG